MRKHRVIRPRGGEALEPRAVPTAAVASVTVPTGLPGISVTLPSQVPVNSPQVKAAFAAFDQSFLNAVDNVLLAPGPNGLVVPSANRAAFDAAIEGSLEALATALLQSLGTSPTASPAATQVSAAITGGGSSSLESQIQALTVEAIEQALPPIPNVVAASTGEAPIPLVMTTAEQVRPTLRPPTSSEDLAANFIAESTSSSSSASARAATDVRSAFNSFLADYFKAVQGVLLAPDAAGQVSPQGRRAAFDARVGQALQALDIQLTSALGRYPGASALAPQIKSALEGAGASSLKGQLANLPTPDGPQAAVRDFTLGSTRAIAQALSLISGDVTKALTQP
jgi:hypothetical protein